VIGFVLEHQKKPSEKTKPPLYSAERCERLGRDIHSAMESTHKENPQTKKKRCLNDYVDEGRVGLREANQISLIVHKKI
jgi:hypothetical protein